MVMDPRAQYAYNFYLQRGYSPQAAAGIVGNIHAESGFNTNASGDKGSAYGLTQLRGDRQQGLYDYANKNGLDPSSMDAQLGYVDYEMRTGRDAGAARAYQQLQNAQTPSQAASAFMNNYERPNADPNVNNIAGRQSFANNIYGVDPSSLPTVAPASGAPSSLDVADSTAQGIASIGGQAAGALPTVQAAQASDPISGIFSLLAAGTPKQQAPPPAPPPERRVDTRTPDEKLAATSQTPNVYYERLRNQYGQS